LEDRVDVLGLTVDLITFGVFLALVFLALLRIRRFKALSSIELSDISFFDLAFTGVRSEAGLSELRQKLKGIEDLRISTIRFQNTGTLPIRSQDFESDIIFEFEPEAKILVLEISDSEPKDLQQLIHLSAEGNIARLPKQLFNSGDWINLTFVLVDHKGALPEPRSRVVGLKNIKVRQKHTRTKLVLIGFAYFLMFLTAIFDDNIVIRTTALINCSLTPVVFFDILDKMIRRAKRISLRTER
jgi:hypothetical protein